MVLLAFATYFGFLGVLSVYHHDPRSDGSAFHLSRGSNSLVRPEQMLKSMCVHLRSECRMLSDAASTHHGRTRPRMECVNSCSAGAGCNRENRCSFPAALMWSPGSSHKSDLPLCPLCSDRSSRHQLSRSVESLDCAAKYASQRCQQMGDRGLAILSDCANSSNLTEATRHIGSDTHLSGLRRQLPYLTRL
jgi:hypothetical protein